MTLKWGSPATPAGEDGESGEHGESSNDEVSSDDDEGDGKEGDGPSTPNEFSWRCAHGGGLLRMTALRRVGPFESNDIFQRLVRYMKINAVLHPLFNIITN